MPAGTLSSLLEKTFPAVAFGIGLQTKYLSISLKKLSWHFPFNCNKKPYRSFYGYQRLVEAAGHFILRTPQYHPELQPIETCWGVVKNYMAAHCDFTMKNFRKQLPLAFAKVTSRTCKSLIAEVVKQEEKYWDEDNKLYEEIAEDASVLCWEKQYQVIWGWLYYDYSNGNERFGWEENTLP